MTHTGCIRICTVEPLNNEMDHILSIIERCPLSEAKITTIGWCIRNTEVSIIQSVLYQRFHCVCTVSDICVLTPCVQPYDLPEAEPLILVQEGRHSTPLSTTGLHHWRTVLSMLNSASPSTEIISPPTSHPPRAPKTNHQPPHYTIEDHKCNLQLRSAFLPTEKTFILTPLQAPPHPLVVRKWLDSKIATKKSSKSENSSTTDTENHPLSVLGDGGVIGGAPVVIETESSSSNKSPNVSQLCQEQASFTSYQIPKQQRAQESDSVTASIDCRKNIESESRLVNNSASEEPAQRDPMNVRNDCASTYTVIYTYTYVMDHL